MIIVSRRSILASAALACVPAVARGRAPESFFKRAALPVGLQLYSLGDAIEKDLLGTLLAVAKMGYRTVEFAGFGNHTVADVRSALAQSGLRGDGNHFTDSDFTKPGTPALEDARAVGLDYAIVSFPPIPDRYINDKRSGEIGHARAIRLINAFTPDDWQWIADRLNRHAETARSIGLKLAYHNHNVEFAPVGESNGYDLLLRYTSPQLVTFELDIGWVTAAGIDAAKLLRANRGRFRLAHLKDVQTDSAPNTQLELAPIELGSGKVDWKNIVPAAVDAGVSHFFVEQEPPFTRSRFETAQLNFEYLDRLIA